MKKITALLVDDEISAINTLRGMLNEYFPQVEVVAEARSVSDALLKVQRVHPDLVFLDVEMPPFGSGFDFLEKCGEFSFGVIFVTAYSEYAIKAINDVEPWAYLLKPVNIAGLGQAIEKAIEKINLRTDARFAIPASQSIIIADARKGNIVIRVRDIIYCKADGTTTDIFYQKETDISRITASKTLKDVEEQLPAELFCRTHHSFLVNLDAVEGYARTGRNGVIHLKQGGEVPISVGKMEDFESQFNTFLHIE